ncbi:hypothetical protein PYCC9005_004410 [Savitreella phatthalungensis]
MPGISEQDVLNHAHVQSLHALQSEISTLRTDLPAILKPLLSSRLDGKATGAGTSQADFRERAVKLQSDVRSLIKHLEEICDTLEATEQLRQQDESGLVRANVTREEPAGIRTTELATESNRPGSPVHGNVADNVTVGPLVSSTDDDLFGDALMQDGAVEDFDWSAFGQESNS